jgi:integrase
VSRQNASAAGITERRTAKGERRYLAEAYDSATKRRVYRTFTSPAAARNWRRDMQVSLARGEARASVPTTMRAAYSQWFEKAEAGEVRARGGAQYKPSVLHSYRLSFEGRLLASFGRVKVGELRRSQIQHVVDAWVAEGLAPQTIRNHVTALRVLLKWCVRTELVAVNPCDGLELPAGGAKRDRIAPPDEAIELLGALQRRSDRALMATAFFAGLRRGELMALRWEDVDLASRTITVQRSYDPTSQQFVAPKSKAGVRTLGIPLLLVPFLEGERTAAGVGLVFTADRGGPFSDSAVRLRAMGDWGWRYDRPEKAWTKTRADALDPIGLHEARHTYASLLIAANVNVKTISEWMGHSSITITLDRYGHLLPGSAKVALGLLDEFLSQSVSQSGSISSVLHSNHEATANAA